MVGLYLDYDVRVGRLEAGQPRHQPLLREGFDRDQPDAAGGVATAMNLGGGREVVEDAPHVGAIGPAALVETHAAATQAIEQGMAEVLLKHLDAVGDAGGGDAEFPGRADEALAAGRGLEEAQAIQRWQLWHHTPPGWKRDIATFCQNKKRIGDTSPKVADGQ